MTTPRQPAASDEEHRAQMAQSFEVIYAPDAAQAASAIAEHGARVTVVLTIGATGLSAAQIDALPHITLICASPNCGSTLEESTKSTACTCGEVLTKCMRFGCCTALVFVREYQNRLVPKLFRIRFNPDEWSV